MSATQKSILYGWIGLIADNDDTYTFVLLKGLEGGLWRLIEENQL